MGNFHGYFDITRGYIPMIFPFWDGPTCVQRSPAYPARGEPAAWGTRGRHVEGIRRIPRLWIAAGSWQKTTCWAPGRTTGWWLSLPLWKIRVGHLGWWNSQLNGTWSCIRIVSKWSCYLFDVTMFANFGCAHQIFLSLKHVAKNSSSTRSRYGELLPASQLRKLWAPRFLTTLTK